MPKIAIALCHNPQSQNNSSDSKPCFFAAILHLGTLVWSHLDLGWFRKPPFCLAHLQRNSCEAGDCFPMMCLHGPNNKIQCALLLFGTQLLPSLNTVAWRFPGGRAEPHRVRCCTDPDQSSSPFPRERVYLLHLRHEKQMGTQMRWCWSACWQQSWLISCPQTFRRNPSKGEFWGRIWRRPIQWLWRCFGAAASKCGRKPRRAHMKI